MAEYTVGDFVILKGSSLWQSGMGNNEDGNGLSN